MRISNKEYVFTEWQTDGFIYPDTIFGISVLLKKWMRLNLHLTPKPRRASLPLLGRIEIPLRSQPRLFQDHNEECFSISDIEKDQIYVFSVPRNYLSNVLSAIEWIEIIRHIRKKNFWMQDHKWIIHIKKWYVKCISNLFYNV